MGQASTHAAATNTNPARDLYEIGFALKRAQHEFRLALNAELASLGTNISQLNVLRAIRDNPGISSAQLARNGFLTPQTLGQQVIQQPASNLAAVAAINSQAFNGTSTPPPPAFTVAASADATTGTAPMAVSRRIIETE